ncbi:MAG TPA: hypothetical protein VNM72_04020 [Blastocatellia bacterium]|nr:hypothetical protein [Blastocatellia bacterium]
MKLSLSLLLLSGVTVGLAYSIRHAREQTPPMGFTLIATQTFTLTGNSKSSLRAIHVRYQRSNGAFKEVATYYRDDGTVDREDVVFGMPGRGVFRVGRENQVLDYLSAMQAKRPKLSEDALAKDPHLVRVDSVLGYKTYVLRFPKQNGVGYTEVYVAPALQGIPIKVVMVWDRGVEVIEPTKIQLGEPPESVFAETPDWPVKYDLLKQKIQAAEQAGHPDVAQELRQQLGQMQQQKRER